MKRIIAFLVLAILACTFMSCNKNKSGNESIFYGTWVKGTNSWDTLWFYQKGGKNILAFNLSSNPALPAPTEVEYFYNNEKLSFRYPASPGSVFHIDSFNWTLFGKEFDILGYQLFNVMSSTQTHFRYNKIQ
jgi:hypothetical protein